MECLEPCGSAPSEVTEISLLPGPSPQPSGLPSLDYFEPIFTTRRARPRARLLASVFLPPRVFIRSRKPCLFKRFRFRGLYVGFITFWCLESSSHGHMDRPGSRCTAQ